MDAIETLRGKSLSTVILGHNCHNCHNCRNGRHVVEKERGNARKCREIAILLKLGVVDE